MRKTHLSGRVYCSPWIACGAARNDALDTSEIFDDVTCKRCRAVAIRKADKAAAIPGLRRNSTPHGVF